MNETPAKALVVALHTMIVDVVKNLLMKLPKIFAGPSMRLLFTTISKHEDETARLAEATAVIATALNTVQGIGDSLVR
jgi:hypothetical protein